MSATLSRHIRSVLEGIPDALPPTELFLLVDEFVSECSLSKEREVRLFQLEDDLQALHHDIVDHSSLSQTEIFMAVLYHLRALLSPSSIILIWFDLFLRPALREAKLSTTAVNHAKELIISALTRADQNNPEKVYEFRRRLLDLYLLDAFNGGSGDDFLEWADLDQAQRQKGSRWKENLENILLTFGTERPYDFMTEIHDCFSTPSSRLQLLMLLSLFISEKSFPSSAATVLATHPLMSRVLCSLLLDNSSTLCTIGLTLLVKLFPIFAMEACEPLKIMLPNLLAILARVLCWRERPPSLRASPIKASDIVADTESEGEQEISDNHSFDIHSDLHWERLDLSFRTTTSSVPSPRRYFTILYYLFPCNVLIFLRNPVLYLTQNNFRSPYTLGWEDVLDESRIRSKSETLLRGHTCHPLIIWRDAAAELSLPDFWTRYDVARIVTESKMLDVRNAALVTRERYCAPERNTEINPTTVSTWASQAEELSTGPIIAPIDLPSGGLHISLQDMVATSIALKCDLHLNISKPTSQWPSALLRATTTSGRKENIQVPRDSSSLPGATEIPSHVAEAIAVLQREVLLLRNELNFELWLSRENVKHIGRLYQDRILSKTAEAERQGLYNKLRKYRTQVTGLEKELRDHKEQASSAKNKYSDWNSELGKKLREFREEKKSWISEAATLRTAQKETQALFAAQGKLLEDATEKVFQLQTQIKAVQPKIDRLTDYERQIEQHTKMQRLWDEDFKNFNERAEQIELIKCQYKQMGLRIQSYEQTLAELEEAGRAYRRQIQALEARLSLANKKSETSRQRPAAEIAAFVAEKSTLLKANTKLRTENAELIEEVEEMKAMIEMLKGQVSRKKGLISDPRASPTFS